MKILLVSSAIAPLGSPVLGGLAQTIADCAQELVSRGHGVQILGPEGSVFNHAPIIVISGTLAQAAQAASLISKNPLPESFLHQAWAWITHNQSQYDVILNFSYDVWPLQQTLVLQTPVKHFISMAKLSDEMDQALLAITKTFPPTRFPPRLAAYTRTQAQTFTQTMLLNPQAFALLGAGLDLAAYPFNPTGGKVLAWVGRISPEKGLEVAMAVSEQTQKALWVMGHLSDPAYWNALRAQFAKAPVRYWGCLDKTALAKTLGQCQALLMTSGWVEALGYVVLEALACGVPVLVACPGGPREIVTDGLSGFVLPNEQALNTRVNLLLQALPKVSTLSRLACRQAVEKHYSLSAFGDRLEAWLRETWLQQAACY